MAEQGNLDLAYTNNLFSPDKARLGFHIIARPNTPTIRGEIVVLPTSPIRSIIDLSGRQLAFPSQVAFVAYQVTGDALVKAGISVNARFAGNQEGAMGQLRAGVVDAASVNSALMADYAAREHMDYRVVWASADYLDIPIMVAPTVKPEVASVIRDALVGMATTEEGRSVLARSAQSVGSKPAGFVYATDDDYEQCRRFFREANLEKLPK